MWGWYIGMAVLVAVALFGMRYGLRHRIDRKSTELSSTDRPTAEALRKIQRDIDRGRGIDGGTASPFYR